MNRKIDVFLCYRRFGAQTAKLFKKYLEKENFKGDVWYSDLENHGHLIEDISLLIESAQSAVLFIDQDFTRNFEDEDCITALEIMAIVKKASKDPNFRVFEIFLNRATHEFTSEEKSTLARALKTMEKHIEVITKRNARTFNTYTDDEEMLVRELLPQLLPPEYYVKRINQGDFSFGNIFTYVDIPVCDFKKSININNISFCPDDSYIKTYEDVCKFPYSERREIQNNTVISFVGAEVTLSDNNEDKKILIRYQSIEYALYNKMQQLLKNAQLGLRTIIANYCFEDERFSVPNAMGLSFMVVTADHKLLFTKRSLRRVLRPCEYDVSIVEGLKLNSIGEGGYLESEIIRAYNEEICEIMTEMLDIRCFALAFDKEYAQWNFVGTIFTKQNSETIIRTHSTRDDSSEKNEIFFVSVPQKNEVSIEVIKKRLSMFIHSKMWGMGLITLYSALRTLGFSENDILEISKL